MTTLWLDFETYSEADLKSAATHAYAEHPSTKITVAAWAIDDREPEVVDCTLPSADSRLYTLSNYLHAPDVTIVAHNSAFDRTLLRHVWGIDVPPERWRDTMVQAMAHGLPGSLDKLGAILGLPQDQAKDRRGRELIQLFCKPRPVNQKLRRATRETHPKEWAEFLEYAGQDVVAMRAIAQRLPTWNWRGDELALWHLDQRINDRGFRVDADLARAAVAAVGQEQKRLKAETVELTDGLVDSPSRRDQLLAYILAEHGVELPDMRADTLRRRAEDPNLPDPVRLLLNIRLEATKTSTAKYTALLRAMSADGRLRNTLQFCGAQRTGRWAGRVFQPQNLPRPYMDNGDIDLGIDALKGGFAEVVFPNVMGLTANAVRGCIVAPEGKKLVIADLSNIEGRMLAFLAGERWKLQAFADFDAGRGADLYKVAYGRSFNVDPSDVTKPQRQIGKVMELGLGYEGGVGAFLTFAAVYQMDLEQLADSVFATASRDALKAAGDTLAWVKKQRRSTYGLSDSVYIACETLKAAWREAHANTTALWRAAGDAVRQAVANPGEAFTIGPHLKARRDGTWLRIRLPSGRYLCYLSPEVDESGGISYMGIDQYTRQWKRLATYGGKIVENATQAAARDVLAANMPTIDRLGYEIVLTVHDELLTETPDTDEFTADRLAQLMATAPAWAKGLPLAAAGFETRRYRKD